MFLMLSKPDFIQKSIMVIHSYDVKNIRFHNENILVEDDAKIKNQASLHKLFAIFLIGEATISTQLIRKLQNFGVALVLLRKNLEVVSVKISRWLCPKFVLPIKFKIKNYCLPKSVRKMKFSTKPPINFTLSQEVLLYAKIRSNYLASNETRQNIFSMNIIAKWIGWADIRAPKLTKITFYSIWAILFCFIF